MDDLRSSEPRFPQILRPDLRAGDKIEVWFLGPDPGWVLHEFVDWHDMPVNCPVCEVPRANSQFVVKSLESGKLMFLDYVPEPCVPWRKVGTIG